MSRPGSEPPTATDGLHCDPPWGALQSHFRDGFGRNPLRGPALFSLQPSLARHQQVWTLTRRTGLPRSSCVFQHVLGHLPAAGQAVGVVELPVNAAVDSAHPRLLGRGPESGEAPRHAGQSVRGRFEAHIVGAEELRQTVAAAALKLLWPDV